MKEIKTNELQDAFEQGEQLSIIDVRRDDEVAEGKIPGAKHIILDELPERFEEIDKNKTQYLVCRSGGRSSRAGEFLESKGYDVVNVDGGMLNWTGETE
ncbi:MAG TPA: rhodanese-like domain-containing protein [Pseudogracilibacillus sp.]|nr:rhodanese-like domain-containing protein [Pseudogracilibacillus sp.]